MASGGQDGREGRLGKRLSFSHESPQPLAQGLPEERSPEEQDPPQEEDGEEEESERCEARLEGVLNEDTAAEGLHTLGYSAPGTEYVYLHLALPGRELSDISILSGYIHLQKMDLSCNKINDLSCISHMPYLIELNASRNELTTFFNFKPPKNLREVDFSHNQILKMQDLSAYYSLTKLLLDYNEIEEIRGLEKCHSLTQLGLSHNRLTAIRGLENLPIRILNLSFNQIEKVNGLKKVKALRRVDLSHNKINSLQGLEGHDLLEVLNLEDNQVAEVSELKWIQDLPLLRVLNLLKNPLQEQKYYWLSAILLLLQVTELDLKKVSVEEKVAAVNEHDPPPEVVAAADHRTQVFYNLLQPQRVLHSTLPDPNDSYPMLVLVGPVAGGRRQLSIKICKKFKNFFRFGPCHTTRTAYFGEANRLDYYFISQEEFDKMVTAGKFLVTYKYSGHWYGLARDTVESIASQGLATCVHLEMEGVHSLKKTHFKPRYILLVPKDKRKYEEHLRRTGLFTRPEIAEAVSRVDVCLQINQDFPADFDAVINTDELEEAFTELTGLVRNYLNLEPDEFTDNIQGTKSRAGLTSVAERFGSILDPLEEGRESVPSGTQSQYLQPVWLQEAANKSSRAQLSPEKSSCLCQGIPAHARSPSPRDLLHLFARNYPKKLLFVLDAPLSSVVKAEEVPPRRSSSAARQALHFHSLREFGRVKDTALSPDEAGARLQEPRGAGRGVDASKGTEVPGENLLRKSSKAKLGSSPVPQLQSQPGSHSKPVLPPIPPGQKSTNP